MSRKAKHNAKVRAAIVQAAADTFCRDGYAGASIDRIMRQAGLTRGAFYTHFASKAALCEAVLCEVDPVTHALARRSDRAPDALWLGLDYILRACVDQRRGERLRACWVLPALLTELDAVGQGAHAAFTAGMDRLVDQALRGAPPAITHDALRTVLTDVIATVSIARRMPDGANGPLEGVLHRLNSVLDLRPPGTHRVSQPRIGYRSGSSKTSKATEPA